MDYSIRFIICPGVWKASVVEVQVFGVRDRQHPHDHSEWSDLPLTLADPLGIRAFGFAPGLLGSLRQAKIAVLHAQGLWMHPSLASLRWARGTRNPYMISPRGMLDPWAVRNAAWKKRLVGWWFEDAHLGGAACLHALTRAEARAIRAYGLRNPICVIPNGVDLPPDEVRGPPAWADAVGNDHRTLLFLGRLHTKKGLIDLLRAWGSLERDGAARDWALVIAGWDEGGHERELRRLAQELGLSVCFAGPQFDEAGPP